MKNKDISLDAIFDSIVHRTIYPKAPSVLYHYTNWGGAAGIVSSQHFHETAHDCTNDDHELLAAHEVITEIAKRLQRKARGAATRALYRFRNAYEELQINKMKTVYMACFSKARDDKEQWNRYGDCGRGVCLGIRILNEPVPNPHNTGSALIQVDYQRTSWETSVTKSFEEICSLLSTSQNTPRNIEQGVSALYRIAAFASIRAKNPKWSVEQEVRHVTIVRDGVHLQPKVARRSDGSEKRYLDDIELRIGGKLLAFAEIIIGPNQDANKGRTRLLEMLSNAGYKTDAAEYPEITVSALDS